MYQDKEIICEGNTKTAIPKSVDDEDDDQDLVFSEKEPEVKPSYRRSQSENLRRECLYEEIMKSNQKLRRSETYIRRKELAGGDETADDFQEDDMSNEEFQRTIEAFIDKQISFHRREQLAVVLHGQA